MLVFTKEFEAGVTLMLDLEGKVIDTKDALEVSGKNLVSIITSEMILLKKQIVANADSKLSSSEQKVREAKKALKSYNDNSSYYTKCLEIAYKLMVNKYDFIDYKNTSVSDMQKVVDLKPSKASLKKDFKATLENTVKAKKAKESKEATTKLNEDKALSNLVKELSSEQLLLLKAYLNKSITAKA